MDDCWILFPEISISLCWTKLASPAKKSTSINWLPHIGSITTQIIWATIIYSVESLACMLGWIFLHNYFDFKTVEFLQFVIENPSVFMFTYLVFVNRKPSLTAHKWFYSIVIVSVCSCSGNISPPPTDTVEPLYLIEWCHNCSGVIG
jgi:hypothetical protein